MEQVIVVAVVAARQRLQGTVGSVLPGSMGLLPVGAARQRNIDEVAPAGLWYAGLLAARQRRQLLTSVVAARQRPLQLLLHGRAR